MSNDTHPPETLASRAKPLPGFVRLPGFVKVHLWDEGDRSVGIQPGDSYVILYVSDEETLEDNLGTLINAFNQIHGMPCSAEIQCMCTQYGRPAVSVWQIFEQWRERAGYLLKESYTCEEFTDAGLPCIGGCSHCGATLAVYNAYPDHHTGNWACLSCVAVPFATVHDFEQTYDLAPPTTFQGEKQPDFDGL